MTPERKRQIKMFMSWGFSRNFANAICSPGKTHEEINRNQVAALKRLKPKDRTRHGRMHDDDNPINMLCEIYRVSETVRICKLIGTPVIKAPAKE